jgi:hypothetical protein
MRHVIRTADVRIRLGGARGARGDGPFGSAFTHHGRDCVIASPIEQLPNRSLISMTSCVEDLD